MSIPCFHDKQISSQSSPPAWETTPKYIWWFFWFVNLIEKNKFTGGLNQEKGTLRPTTHASGIKFHYSTHYEVKHKFKMAFFMDQNLKTSWDGWLEHCHECLWVKRFVPNEHNFCRLVFQSSILESLRSIISGNIRIRVRTRICHFHDVAHSPCSVETAAKRPPEWSMRLSWRLRNGSPQWATWWWGKSRRSSTSWWQTSGSQEKKGKNQRKDTQWNCWKHEIYTWKSKKGIKVFCLHAIAPIILKTILSFTLHIRAHRTHETKGDLKDMPAWKMPKTCRRSEKFHSDGFAGGRDRKFMCERASVKISCVRASLWGHPLSKSLAQQSGGQHTAAIRSRLYGAKAKLFLSLSYFIHSRLTDICTEQALVFEDPRNQS